MKYYKLTLILGILFSIFISLVSASYYEDNYRYPDKYDYNYGKGYGHSDCYKSLKPNQYYSPCYSSPKYETAYYEYKASSYEKERQKQTISYGKRRPYYQTSSYEYESSSYEYMKYYSSSYSGFAGAPRQQFVKYGDIGVVDRMFRRW